VENRAQRIQCVALGGYPPPSIDVYVGDRDVTDQFRFRHGAALTGAVRGMRRIDFRSERATENFRARAGDDRALLRCEVEVPGIKRIVEFVRLDVDCKWTSSPSLLHPGGCHPPSNAGSRLCVCVCVCVCVRTVTPEQNDLTLYLGQVYRSVS